MRGNVYTERYVAPLKFPEDGERRRATPQHRNSVHVAALLLLKLYEDDYLKALERATDWTAGADPETFHFYADVATLLSRRYATLTGGRDG